MKKYLLLLFVGLLGLISFSSAGSLTYTGHYRGLNSAGDVMFTLPNPVLGIPSPDFTLSCDFSNFVGFSSMQVNFGYQYYTYTNTNIPGGSIKQTYYSNYANVYNGNYTFTNDTSNKYIFNSFYFASSSAHSSTLEFDWSCTFQGNSIGNNLPYCNACPECDTCPEVNTGEILSGSCDTNYCVENDLCPVPSNFSQLFINDIEFPSKPLINVSIPDYIYWDYSSSDSGYDINVGSGYDQDYIDSVLKINSYRPDSSDFTNVFVSGLTLIFPYLIFALFIVFMRKLIKRIFKH